VRYLTPLRMLCPKVGIKMCSIMPRLLCSLPPLGVITKRPVVAEPVIDKGFLPGNSVPVPMKVVPPNQLGPASFFSDLSPGRCIFLAVNVSV